MAKETEVQLSKVPELKRKKLKSKKKNAVSILSMNQKGENFRD